MPERTFYPPPPPPLSSSRRRRRRRPRNYRLFLLFGEARFSRAAALLRRPTSRLKGVTR